MKKYGPNKFYQNPEQVWSNENNSIIVPPGSSSLAVGLSDNDNERLSVMQYVPEETFGDRTEPIMGGMDTGKFERRDMVKYKNGGCNNINVNNYLCGQIGKYVKLEFMFGEMIHIEKLGKLVNVGRDFVVIQENGTKTTIVCSLNKIKFINIYDF